MATDLLPVACFAPALSDAKLAEYTAIAAALPAGELRDAIAECLACVKFWWELPESTRTDGRRLRIQKGVNGPQVEVPITPLEDAHVKAIWDAVPWPRELDASQSLFDAIPVGQKALRDCAFHLLWFAKELCLDREPLTQDKL